MSPFVLMSLTRFFLDAARQQEINELLALGNICELVRRAGELIHALQSERGTANAWLASQGQGFYVNWQQKCAASDKALVSLESYLGDPIAGTARLYARIALAINALDRLSAQRLLVDAHKITPTESVEHYSGIIDTLINLIFEAIDTTVDPTVSRLLLALFNLIEGKEYAGLERATGARIAAGLHIELPDRQLLATLIDLQEQAIARFESFCGGDIHSQWHALQSMLPMRELERLRRQLLMPEVLNDDSASIWFDVCSQRIDGLHQVERHLADLIESACRDRITKTQATLTDQTQSLSLPSEWLNHAVATQGESTNHSQRLSSRLNRTLMDLLQQQTANLQTMSAELFSVRAALEDRKLIERAKGLLMAQQGISEEAAYSLLRQKAMSQNARISTVAQSLLSMADFFPTPKH